jgi:predicted nucleic acid-binding protein
VVAWWSSERSDRRVPVTVLPEICYLLHTRHGAAAEARFVVAVAAGEFQVEGLEPEDLTRAAQLVGNYGDVPFGFTDATIVAMAERLGAVTIATTDRRHFGLVRPSHAPAFRLVP